MKAYFMVVIISFSVALPTACVGGGANNQKNANNVGWLHGDCLAIKNNGLEKGEKLSILLLDEKSHFTEGEIVGNAVASDCEALVSDRKAINEDAGFSFYKVSASNVINIAIGIVSNSNSSIDVRVLHNPDNFAYCSSAEGIVFSLWDKGAYKGKKLWSEYYYLGYETESNCPEKAYDH